MRQQAISERMLYGRPIPVGRAVQGIADRGGTLPRAGCIADSCVGAQNNTQMYGRRPYGVGFLVIGRDVRRFPLWRSFC